MEKVNWMNAVTKRDEMSKQNSRQPVTDNVYELEGNEFLEISSSRLDSLRLDDKVYFSSLHGNRFIMSESTKQKKLISSFQHCFYLLCSSSWWNQSREKNIEKVLSFRKLIKRFSWIMKFKPEISAVGLSSQSEEDPLVRWCRLIAVVLKIRRKQKSFHSFSAIRSERKRERIKYLLNGNCKRVDKGWFALGKTFLIV